MYQNGNNGARSDRFSISDIVFRSMPICVPDNPKEQAAIGLYFQTLDKQLRLYEQKLSKLKNLKSAFLKNMFV
jgi:type I restriction enzyme S subunit